MNNVQEDQDSEDFSRSSNGKDRNDFEGNAPPIGTKFSTRTDAPHT